MRPSGRARGRRTHPDVGTRPPVKPNRLATVLLVVNLFACGGGVEGNQCARGCHGASLEPKGHERKHPGRLQTTGMIRRAAAFPPQSTSQSITLVSPANEVRKQDLKACRGEPSHDARRSTRCRRRRFGRGAMAALGAHQGRRKRADAGGRAGS
jgi:hypothetical protein